VYWVALDPVIGSEIAKTRPAVIISNDIANEKSDLVTVIPLTSNTSRIYPFEVLFPAAQSGLERDSKAKANQIRTIDKKRLLSRLGQVNAALLAKVEEALLLHLGIERDSVST